MKCLVFSDSHGNPRNIEKALSRHRDAELVFFLGDGISDAESIAAFSSNQMWLAVRGNCDFRSVFLGRELLKLEEIELCGKKIVITHGDLYGVKYGLDNLKSLAVCRNADIILFGHTHTPHEEYVRCENNAFYLFNPGSVESSYGILTLTEDLILFSHGKI